MKHLKFSTDKDQPEADDDSLYAKFYKKHDFGKIFESYLSWGPQKIEVNGYVTPKGHKFVAESMHYLNTKEDSRVEREKAPREHLELLCHVFKIPVKPVKNNK